jgi:hypothetical protein
MRTYLRRCVDNWVTEYFEVVSGSLEIQADTKPRVCEQYSAVQFAGSCSEGNVANRTGRCRLSVQIT